MFSGKKIKKYLLFLTAGFVAFFAGGCATEGDDSYREVAGEIDAGGKLYVISDTGSLRTGIQKAAEAFAVENVNSARRRSLNILLANTLLQTSGINDVTAWGASSCETGTEDFPVHNKVFLRIKPDSPGLLNQIFGSKNLELAKELAALPRDVTVAFAADLQMQKIIETLREFGPIGTALLDRVPLDVENTLADIGGTWVVALIMPHNMDNLSIGSVWFYLSLPDKNEKFFNTLNKVSTTLLKFKYDEKNKRLSGDENFTKEIMGFSPVITHRDGRLVIYSSPLAENFFTAADTRRMGDDPEFRRWQKKLPEKGCAMWVCKAREFSPPGKGDVRFGTEKSISMISRTDSGLLLQSFCSSDINAYVINNCYFFYHFFKDTGKQVKKSVSKAGKKSAPPPKPEFPLSACAASMRRAAPEAKLGAKRLYYCPTSRKAYIRFDVSKLKSDIKLPVLMDRPNSHPNAFNVLFSDDSVETFELDKQNNCRRMVSFLQTKFHWQEKIFRELVRQADEFDRNTK